MLCNYSSRLDWILLWEMDAMENPVLEPRSERIARYKAERRRELAERYGNMEELPTKWVRRDRKEAQDPATQTHRGALSSDSLGERVNGRMQGVTNGLEADAPAESNCLRRWVTHEGQAVEMSCNNSKSLVRFIWVSLQMEIGLQLTIIFVIDSSVSYFHK